MVVSRPRSRSRASCRCCRAASTRCRCCWTVPCPRASTRPSWSCTWRRRTSRRGWAWPSPSTTSCPRGSKPNSRRSGVCFKQRRESWERISYFLLRCSVCVREDLLYACATLGIFVKFGMRLRWAPLSFYYYFFVIFLFISIIFNFYLLVASSLAKASYKILRSQLVQILYLFFFVT